MPLKLRLVWTDMSADAADEAGVARVLSPFVAPQCRVVREDHAADVALPVANHAFVNVFYVSSQVPVSKSKIIFLFFRNIFCQITLQSGIYGRKCHTCE